MVFINKNVAIAALLVAPVIAAPLTQTVEDLERRGDVELEERGTKTNIAVGAVGGLLLVHALKKLFHKKEDAPAPPADARDFVDGELEERGTKTNIATGVVGGVLLKKLWDHFHHKEGDTPAPPVDARDLVDFIYAREVLNRARALERRNALEYMIDELD
ncbi:hypothetical protein DFP72DRAFT_1048565 [Ephemerocybe angulata]|uniref:Uncharacterized protein n=1 Tax=Ephemerocybe angulata TaxID=980116 RepID=A0A8H6M1R8_9AGAR|nr:hypothetical protein DFP72DRAFT_1048565 [Tulosesus angulatus]